MKIPRQSLEIGQDLSSFVRPFLRGATSTQLPLQRNPFITKDISAITKTTPRYLQLKAKSKRRKRLQHSREGLIGKHNPSYLNPVSLIAAQADYGHKRRPNQRFKSFKTSPRI